MSKKEKKKKNRQEQGYLRSVAVEVSKIVWPTKEKVRKDTIVVCLTCIFFSLMYWGVNTGVLAIVKTVLGKAI